MELIKIYDKTCDICSMLSGLDEQLAEDAGMFFRQITVGDCAQTPSPLRDYVVNVHVNPADGQVDIPIYLVVTPQGQIQGSRVAKTIKDVQDLLTSWQKWDTTQNASSAP